MRKFKLFNFILLTYLFISSCKCNNFCNDNRNPNDYLSTTIDAVFSNKLDSIINIGDTIELRIKLKDTLKTNRGDLELINLTENSYFNFKAFTFDSITNFGMVNRDYIPITPIVYNKVNSVNYYWDTNQKDFKCYIIPNKKGKCLLEINGGDIIMNTRSTCLWIIGTQIIPTNRRNKNQLLSWISEDLRTQYDSIYSQKNNWYCFEVR